jgi:uncharacterized repeat protein (TIGR02543 family)
MTVYAQWTATPYTITYNVNGGDYINPGTYTVNNLPFTLPTPTRSGYTFYGWLDDATGVTDTKIPTDSTGNKTFTALWTGLSYNITYNLNNGTFSENPAYSYTAESLPFTLPTPTRSGYTFNGWYDYATGTTGTAIPTGSTGNKTFIAQWTGISYNITYNLNSGTFSENPAYSYTAESLPFTLPTPTRSGYTFDGWYDYATGITTAIPTGSTGDKTFDAQWTATPYTITYNVNGGDFISQGNYTVESIFPISLPTPTPTGGYDFGGWYDNEGFNGIAVTTISAGSMGDKDFYAKWTRDITLNVGDAGDGAFSQENFTIFKSGTPNSQPITITGTGYTNPRWFVDGILKGTGTNITISATDYNLGGHNLSLIITKGGVSWSKEITFTVSN